MLSAEDEFAKRGIIAHSPAQHDRIAKIAQEVFHAGKSPPSQWRPYEDVILVGVAIKHGLQAREQHREKRDILSFRQGFRGLRELWRYDSLRRFSCKGLYGGARPIREEIQGRGHSLELLSPPGELPSDRLPAQMLTLPDCMIPVLKLEGGDVGCSPFTARRVWEKISEKNRPRVQSPSEMR